MKQPLKQPVRLIMKSAARACALLTALVGVLVMGAACSSAKSSAPAKSESAAHGEHDGHNHDPQVGHGEPAAAPADAEMCPEHHVAEAECPFCDESLVLKLGTCAEHGVPEALCSRCKPALEAAFKANGDWCGEHALPESQCTLCNPGLLDGVTVAAAHAGDEVTLSAEAIARNGIRVEPARRQALAEQYAVPGRVSYNTEAMAHIGTPVAGRVAELKVKLGDMVDKGDVLLVIDSPALGETQSTYLQKRTEVEVARSALDVARTSAERAKRLYEGQGISLGEFQRREGEYKAAQGALRAAESAATAARNNLQLHGMAEAELARLVKTGEINPRYAVRAPLAGRVVEREATLGEVVGPEREALLVLADMKVLWVLADLPEDRIQDVALGTPAAVSVAALSGRQFSGKVTYIAPALNNETRTAQVRIEIENGATPAKTGATPLSGVDLPLKPGMFAQVQLGLGQAEGEAQRVEALAVPESAVQSFEGGQAVFVAVANEPGTFVARAIKAGSSDGRMVSVDSGLEEGAPVVVDGAFVIKAELAKGIMEGKTCSGH